ncbi:hypothetical protein PR048_013066 [Dryococelus australis]|uniref:Uncharacterized protein n=1 Tax=Dryococelus australis TaxID=614101 RepID=A0ABQ9HRX5_9NEOP|nr:hypothetical protein PR048_013066 [Dryococelus australis]
MYAPNSVSHMSGKEVSKAVRGHMLVDSALTILLSQQTFQSEQNSEINPPDITEVRDLFDKIIPLVFVFNMDLIGIMRVFNRAEQTGQWNLYLEACQSMIPFFAGTEHNNYAKSMYLHLQQMLKLDKSHPDVYRLFLMVISWFAGQNVFWGGLARAMAIEQVLIRSVKSAGAWILYMPSFSEINNAMQELTSHEYNTSDQHKDCSTSRVERDSKDLNALF